MHSHCLDKPQTVWFDALPLVEFAINTTVNASTGFVPFYLVYGDNVPLPIDHALSAPQPTSSSASSLVKHIHKIVNDARAAM